MIKKFFYISVLAVVLIQLSFAMGKDPKNLFSNKIQSYLGEYQLTSSPSNDSRCSSGNLSLVGKDIDEGVRLGHHIFLGPFSKSGKIADSKDYCTIDVNYKFTQNSVTERTELSKCPKESKGDEAVSTKSLELKKDTVIYKVKESGFLCIYQKTKQGK